MVNALGAKRNRGATLDDTAAPGLQAVLLALHDRRSRNLIEGRVVA